ncbi:MAG: MFS transporter [Anaerolineae bacterium]
MSRQISAGAFTLILAYLAFIVLGTPDGMLGVGWPSIRDGFGLENAAQGILLVASTVGYLIASSGSGALIARLGISRALIVSSLSRAVGLLGYALAPFWGAMAGLGLMSGLGGGAIDAGLNTYVAANYSARYMNWLHASYGIGASLGPLIMGAALDVGGSWRWGYATVAVVQVGIALAIAVTRKRWDVVPAPDASATGSAPRLASSRDTLRLPMVWLGIALFFMTAGIEITAGNWSYTLFTEGRGVAPDLATGWIGLYWLSFTIGRIIAGVIVAATGAIRLLRISAAGLIVGALLLWVNASDALSFVGLIVIGFAIAPLFPLLVSCTPARVGAEHAANAIGFQVAAAGLGIAVLPGLAGVLMTQTGNLEVIGPYMVAFAVIFFALHEFTLARERRVAHSRVAV